MSKVHMTEDGPKPCNASIRSCKYGEHFENMREGMKAWEAKNSEKYNSLKTISKNDNSDMNPQKIVDDITIKNLQNKLDEIGSKMARISNQVDELNEYGDERLLGGASSYEVKMAELDKLDEEYVYIESQMNAIKNGGDGGDSLKKEELTLADRELISSMVDRNDDEWREYYEATDAKHFSNPDAPGSKFTDENMKRVEDVLELAIKQRGGLEGDDREKFIAEGSPPDAFRDGNRYLMIKTPGKLGVQSLKDMKDDELLEVTRTKPGVPCNIVKPISSEDSKNLTTDSAVAVVTNDDETGKPILITTFPGVVTKNVKSDELDALEGEKITVAKARELLGDDAYANTRVVESNPVMDYLKNATRKS